MKYLPILQFYVKKKHPIKKKKKILNYNNTYFYVRNLNNKF